LQSPARSTEIAAEKIEKIEELRKQLYDYWELADASTSIFGNP